MSNDIREVCVFKFNYELPVLLKEKSLEEELRIRVLEAIMKQMKSNSGEASNELGTFLGGTNTDPAYFPMTRIIQQRLVGNITLEKSEEKKDWTLSKNVYKNIGGEEDIEKFLLWQKEQGQKNINSRTLWRPPKKRKY